MYDTSELYKEILNSSEQRYGSYIELEDGTKITSNDDLSGLKITDTIGNNLIGNFSPKIANISILNNKNYDLTDKRFKLFAGLYLNDTDIEYIPYGTFIVSKPTENDKATKEISLEAKDISYLFDVEYERELFESIFPCTVIEWTQAICNKVGVPLANIDFPNADTILHFQPYTEDGATYRNVIAKIAEAVASFAKTGRDDKLYFKQITSVVKIAKNITLNTSFEQTKDDLLYGPINSIVASRIVADDGSTTEDVYVKDEESISKNGLCEYKIKENWIIDDNREEFIKNILESLGGTTFNTGNVEIISDPSLDVGDFVEVSDVENDTSFILLVMNNELDATTYTSIIESSMPSKTETDYNSATTSKKEKIRRTELKVNKLEGEITSVIENVTEQNNKISQVTQTVDELNSKISDIADITTFGESIYAKVELDAINESEPINITVKPTVENISYLYSNSGLYPSETLYPKVRTLRFTNKSLKENEEGKYIDFIFPDDLLIASDGTCDEFYLGYDEQICQVIKRCKYNEDGTVSKLDTEQIINYEYPKIQLKDGDYIIELLGYTNAYLGIRLMAQNIYTTQFATKAEVSSEINQTAQEIDLNVNKKLTSYSTTTEMNSAISMSANSITSNVSQTYATKTELTTAQSEIKQTTDSITSTVSKKVGEDEIISKINQSAEAVGIDANKIELSAADVLNLLAGNTINLSSKNIQISSTHLKIGKDGKLKILGDSSSNDLFRVENNSSTEFSYIMPVGAGFVGSNGRVDIYAENGDFGSSGIDVMDSDGTTTVRGKQIQTPGIKSQNIYSNNNVTSSANMYITSNGNVRRTTNTSSKRYKTDITNKISEELNPERLYDLEVKQFKYKEEYQPVKEDARYNQNLIGFIAEDVAKIFPIASDYEIDEQGNSYIENWNERYIVPAMLKLIQEQHKVQLMHEKQIAEQRLIIKSLQEQLKE